MKNFLSKILVFILPILFLTFPLDILISEKLKASNSFAGEIEVWNDVYSGRINVDVAIYGSSRAFVHFNPRILEAELDKTVYNFGIDGHNFFLQYLRHLQYTENNKKPKQIILAVDIFSLQKRPDLYNLEQFLPYMLWNAEIQEYTSSYEGFSELDYQVPLIRYFGRDEVFQDLINKMFLLNEEDHRYKGFRGMELEWNTDLDAAKKKVEKYQIKLDPTSVKLFEDFIIECKKSEIDLVLVYAPEYIEGQKFIANRSMVIDLFETFSQQYNLLFLNYSEDDLSFEKRFFYNSLHLNSKGANLFSSKLAMDLKEKQ